ncbi:MAG: beta-glucosidase [Armatimonadetes bacterium]|nr:beta-glucosidase [Armatimonadota bacterium]
MVFPEDFGWGAATASYQIEGGADTRGDSVWDAFCRWPGKTANGHDGSVACDHVHRFREDVALMKEIGLNCYRLSISWPRVMPSGTGQPSEEGLAFYDALFDALLEAGVTPWVTLFHWDLPLALHHQGGWLNPDAPKWFEDYAALLSDRFGDRVHHWMTFNEPQCTLGLGHVDGIHAPGLKLSYEEVLTALKHLLLAHGRAAKVLRSRSGQKVGIAPVSNLAYPATESAADIEACRSVGFDRGNGIWPQCFYLDPIVHGRWPDEQVRKLFPAFEPPTAEEMAIIHGPLDFIGLNYYHSQKMRAGADGKPEVVELPAGHPETAMGWPVVPEGLYWTVRFHHERYGLPSAITENGMANLDWVQSDGRVDDPQRVDYLRLHLRQLGRALNEGLPVWAYFHWSLMDNFEWAEGYHKRFGLVHVDFQTQKRTLKSSARAYQEIIRQGGVEEV